LYYSATFFYQDGNAGACGTVHSDNDFICAIDQSRYGNSGDTSSLCGQQVQITNQINGNTVVVTIADDCPTCANENSIDLSVAAFQALDSLSVGDIPSMSCLMSTILMFLSDLNLNSCVEFHFLEGLAAPCIIHCFRSLMRYLF